MKDGGGDGESDRLVNDQFHKSCEGLEGFSKRPILEAYLAAQDEWAQCTCKGANSDDKTAECHGKRHASESRLGLDLGRRKQRDLSGNRSIKTVLMRHGLWHHPTFKVSGYWNEGYRFRGLLVFRNAWARLQILAATHRLPMSSAWLWSGGCYA